MVLALCTSSNVDEVECANHLATRLLRVQMIKIKISQRVRSLPEEDWVIGYALSTLKRLN